MRGHRNSSIRRSRGPSWARPLLLTAAVSFFGASGPIWPVHAQTTPEPETLNAPPVDTLNPPVQPGAVRSHKPKPRSVKRIVKPAPTKPVAQANLPKPDPSAPTLVIPTTVKSQPKIKDIAKDRCFEVSEIEIRGVGLIDPEAVRQAVEPFAWHCIGNVLANNIAGAVSKAYADKGYITTEGYVVEGQDLAKSHRFVLNVIAGRIGSFQYREHQAQEGFLDAWHRTRQARNPWQMLSGMSGMLDALDNPLDRFQLISGESYPALKAWMAAPVGLRDPLQLDRIQQGIDQMNTAPSSHAGVKLQPGAEVGTTDVIIDNPMDDSFRLFAGYEINGGSLNGLGTTTAERLRVDAAKDNLIGINDAWNASVASGLDSNELHGSVSIPWRWWTFSYAQGYSESLQPVGTTAELFTRTYTSNLAASYLAWRSSDLQVSLDSSLSWRRKDRYIDATELAPQSIVAPRFGVSATKRFDTSQLSLGLGVSHGIAGLGATHDPDNASNATPRAQYFKLDGSLSYAYAWQNVGVFKADLTGQWTNHPLYQDDQITLGSPTTVRGFTSSAVTVDSGFVLRSEYAPAIPFDLFLDLPKAGAPSDSKDGKQGEADPGFLASVLPPLQPYVFFDYGFGRDIANQVDLARAGVGAGVRYKYERLNVDFSAAQPVYRTGSTTRFRRDPEVYLTLSVKAF